MEEAKGPGKATEEDDDEPIADGGGDEDAARGGEGGLEAHLHCGEEDAVEEQRRRKQRRRPTVEDAPMQQEDGRGRRRNGRQLVRSREKRRSFIPKYMNVMINILLEWLNWTKIENLWWKFDHCNEFMPLRAVLNITYLDASRNGSGRKASSTSAAGTRKMHHQPEPAPSLWNGNEMLNAAIDLIFKDVRLFLKFIYFSDYYHLHQLQFSLG